jgi:hypothetical protein
MRAIVAHIQNAVNKKKRLFSQKLYHQFSFPEAAGDHNCGKSLRYDDHHFGIRSCDGSPT